MPARRKSSFAAAETWQVVLSAPAERDLVHIFAWTMKKFGMRQAERYQQLILSCLVKLRAGPSVPGARQLKGFDVPIYELRMAGRGRPARHVLFYTPAEEREIQVLRILHDSMDFARHLGSVEQ